MGYYTQFKANILAPDGKTEKTKEFKILLENAECFDLSSEETLARFKDEYVEKLRKAHDALENVDKDAIGLFMSVLIGLSDSMKWYEHESDLKALSKFLPDYIFELRGEGEEAGDVWIKWFYMGRVQGGKAQVILPTLDVKKWSV